ncbi:MAG: hypothetical protein NTW86_23635, partial [Candidatus Sumerlaeota bacterium]|nr:hypothetical protein [Candidatus Sumerlaeota bacterium]
ADKVKIKDKVSGTLKNMLDGGNPIDYAQLGDQWVAKALARWNRNARDKHFGVKPMQVAIPETSDPHVLIERASSSDQPGVADMKFENKADLRIVRQSSGTVAGFDKNGNSVSLTYVDSNHVTQSVYKETTFYNEREGKTVRCLELDIGKLIASGINLGQGLIYMSESPSGSQQPGVRITNGATLPTTLSGGFTLATDDPLYIKGNFNTGSNHINALLSGDAINILSNAWQDSQNASHDTTVRSASATETNALFLSGNVPSGGNKYSGGAENFFRYSEDWSGVTHKFRGSLLNLFQSTVATGTWTYGSPVYNAPNRDWGWDTVYSGINPPPGMVDVFVLKTTRWEVVGSSS